VFYKRVCYHRSSAHKYKVGANQSRKIEINLNYAQKEAFERLKNVLASEEVTVMYPDLSKHFDLTSDASQHGISAVLSQGKRPITMISRAIRIEKEHLAANIKELLRIVWALKSLRNYLYGVQNWTIYRSQAPDIS